MILLSCAGSHPLHLVYFALPLKKELSYKQNIVPTGSDDKESRGNSMSTNYFLGGQKRLFFCRRHTQQIMFYSGQLIQIDFFFFPSPSHAVLNVGS